MNRFLYYIRLLAALTLITAHNLLRMGGLQTVPLQLAFDDEGEDFESKVLGGIGAMKRGHDSLVSNFDNLQRETKTAFEELTRVKRHLNSLADFEQKLKRVELALNREQRMAFGDPIKRVQVDEEMRMRLNAAVRLACKDPHVQKIGADMASSFTQRGLDTENAPGSTLITTALANEIYDTLAMYGIFNTFAVQRVGTSLTKFPVTTARPVAKAVRKLSGRKLVDDATLAGTSVDCEVVLWGVLLGVEIELLQDSSFDVTSYVMEGFGEAMALKLDQLCLTADGTDDEDDFGNSGVFETGTAAVAGAGNTTIESTDLEDWVNCLTVVDSGVLNRPCRWWMNPRTLARAILVRDLNGRPIFQTALEAPTYGGVGSIMGYPVTPAHAAPSANVASAKVAVFGDPRAHVLGLRTDFEFQASDDFSFDAAKRTFRGLARAGSKTRRSQGLAVLTMAAS